MNITHSKTLVGGCRDRPSRALPLTCPNVKNLTKKNKETKAKTKQEKMKRNANKDKEKEKEKEREKKEKKSLENLPCTRANLCG